MTLRNYIAILFERLTWYVIIVAVILVPLQLFTMWGWV